MVKIITSWDVWSEAKEWLETRRKNAMKNGEITFARVKMREYTVPQDPSHLIRRSVVDECAFYIDDPQEAMLFKITFGGE